ncbi:hypothetical protein PHLGIDRAFT_126982 [Phlebiopsis gigantea 11061_1 CR5-6]|uniref:DUF6534 domain-containing protein n=1 Tax=Phlebiopsis gigantea (strain 11061_1 CR5-6) TaxID=745531 RepID=A0A0C3S0L5_PHLG1|nr:hypothetical protein PHLGIDRAFT_126982 [Phlebiopsis gigantea 11061_1 CR5-6]
MADPTYDIRPTLGALFIGGLICTFLSGAVSMQAYQYVRSYPNDYLTIRILVSVIWLVFHIYDLPSSSYDPIFRTLDVFHTILVGTSIWDYLIASFGDATIHDKIFWSLGVTVAVTAVLTFCVHCFFVHRLYKLSKGKLWLAGPIGFFALFRLASACVTCAKMQVLILSSLAIQLGSFSEFFDQIRWVFTLGLSLSTFVDVMIAVFMCYFLWNSRTGSSDLDQMLHSVILYTIENGILTSIATVASLVFWLATPHNLVYMGLHFAISKLYASSLLASLNARKSLRQAHVSVVEGQRPTNPKRYSARFSVVTATRSKLEINVEKTIDYVVDEDGPFTPSYQMDDRSTRHLTTKADKRCLSPA